MNWLIDAKVTSFFLTFAKIDRKGVTAMKRYLIIGLLLLVGTVASAQTQQGYVKTKGRMVDGKLVPGQGLKGATVYVQGRTTVLVNADNGSFSFPATNAQFQLDSVRKKGYQMVDMDACPRTYKYSGNPLYIVMETPEQQLQDKLTAERKIRRNLQKQLQEREDEIESLKEQQKISDEEYRQALQKLYSEQESNELLIADMAKRYSELDYDQLDEFYRQVSYCIENGELVKADSLLNTRGDLSKQVEEQLQKGQAIQEQQEKLDKAKMVHAADQEELARRCYSFYETFMAQHLNDTAAYYLELRAGLDTTNVDWQNEAGDFIQNYLADLDRALRLFQRGYRQAVLHYGPQSYQVGNSLNNIGLLYYYQGNYTESAACYNNSLEIRIKTLGEDHHDVGTSYNNIGLLYQMLGDFDKALENTLKAHEIFTKVFEADDPNIAIVQNNLGNIYTYTGDFDKAIAYFNAALAIQEKRFGDRHIEVARSYNNIGAVYYRQYKFSEALPYFQRALDIFLETLGENHTSVASAYNNIGYVYLSLKDYEKSLDYLNKSLVINEKLVGTNHPLIANNYHAIGAVYGSLENYDKALEYMYRALEIRETIMPNHPLTQQLRDNIETTKAKKQEAEKAKE